CALTIKSDTRYLTPLRGFVRAASEAAGLGHGRDLQTALCMAIVEAVDNAIVHAHRRRKALPIRISLVIDRKKIVMEVVDTGSGISHLSFAEPDPCACGGRGLFLINRVMTKVESRTFGRGHKLRMIKLI
ncbi:MAG: ATP-binding protein, partial [bacterium]